PAVRDLPAPEQPAAQQSVRPRQRHRRDRRLAVVVGIPGRHDPREHRYAGPAVDAAATTPGRAGSADQQPEGGGYPRVLVTCGRLDLHPHRADQPRADHGADAHVLTAAGARCPGRYSDPRHGAALAPARRASQSWAMRSPSRPTVANHLPRLLRQRGLTWTEL